MATNTSRYTFVTYVRYSLIPKDDTRMRKIELPYFMSQSQIVAHILSTIAAGGQVDQAYWAALYDQARPWISRALARAGVHPQNIEDGFHEVYLRIFQNIVRIRQSNAFVKYVQLIIRSVARDQRRRQPLQVDIDLESIPMPEPEIPEIEEED